MTARHRKTFVASGAVLIGGLVAVSVPIAASGQSAPDMERGHRVYEHWCAPCHAAGPGHPGTQSLQIKYDGELPAVLEEREDLTPEAIETFVRQGVLSMAPFRKTEITDAELDDLAAYLTHGDRARASSTPRVAPLARNAWSESLGPVAAEFAPGGMSRLVATYANHPALAEAVLPHLRYVLTESTLPARHRAMLGLRTAWLARSDYLWAHQAALALDADFTDEDLERIARGPDAEGWDAFEAALLRAADELYVDAFVSDATWGTLEARYDLPRLIDTVDTVGALTMHAGALNSIGVALEPAVDPRLPSGVSRAAAAERTNERLVGGEPRIPPTPPEDGRGIAANVFNTFVHNPPADRVRGAINNHVNSGSTLDPGHRELLLIRIGVLCRSEYEYAAHVRAGLRAGLTDSDIEMILAGPEDGDGGPIERALLRATDELHRDDRISDETWTELAAEFDTQQLLDVLFAVGGYRSTSMLINSAGVQLDANMDEHRFPPRLR